MTLARSPSAGLSTTLPSAARRRSGYRRPSSSRREPRSPCCAGLSPAWRARPRQRASGSSPAIPRSSGAARRIGCSSRPLAWASSPGVKTLRAEAIRPGDVAIVSGVLGDHGAAILAARGDLALSTDIQSDCQSLLHLMDAVLAATPDVRAARDATRGGLASALNEMGRGRRGHDRDRRRQAAAQGRGQGHV